MKATKMIKTITGALLIAASILCTGCGGLFSGDEKNSSGSGLVAVTVYAGTAEAGVRSAYPSSLKGVSSLSLSITSAGTDYSGSAKTELAVDSSTGTVTNGEYYLLPGVYTFTVKAYNAQNAELLEGTVKSKAISGNAKTVSVVLDKYSETTATAGNIALYMYVPADTTSQTLRNITSVNATDTGSSIYTITKLDGAPAGSSVTTGTWYECSATGISAGEHFVTFALSSSNTVLFYYFDKVVVYPGLTTDTWNTVAATNTTDGKQTASAAASTVKKHLPLTAAILFSASDTSNTYYVAGSDAKYIPAGND